MRLLLNLLWFVLGGWATGLLWLLGGLILAITVIGLPFTFAAWRIASFSFWPFGRMILPRDIATGREDLSTGNLGCILNVIWFVCAGWYIALGHVTLAVAQAVTIIGIPFAYKNIQLAILAIAPVGKEIVEA